MGLIFEVNDQSIWQPSQSVGRLFLQAIASLETLVDCQSGITESNSSDDFEIDPLALRAFVVAVAERLSNSNNESFLALASPTFFHLIALLRRAGGLDAQVVEVLQESWLAEAERIGRHMPH
jgi:hypothetical protein